MTQGSILGGILYTIYSNDLPANRAGDPTDYVDDHADLCHAKTLHDLEAKLQTEADTTSNWLRANGMALSAEKSKILVLHSSSPPQLTIKFGMSDLSPTYSEKYLGLVLSSNMTWQNYLYGEKWRECEARAS